MDDLAEEEALSTKHIAPKTVSFKSTFSRNNNLNIDISKTLKVGPTSEKLNGFISAREKTRKLEREESSSKLNQSSIIGWIKRKWNARDPPEPKHLNTQGVV